MALKNKLKWTVTSQIVAISIGILKVLLIPKLLSIEGYGYYQIFILYTSLIGILSFGYIDGIYLKYGGVNFNLLPKDLIRSSFLVYIIISIIISIVCFSILSLGESEKKSIYLLVIINITPILVISYFLNICKATDKLKEFSLLYLVDKVIFISFLTILMMANYLSYKSVLWLETSSKILSAVTIIAIYPSWFFGLLNNFNRKIIIYLRFIKIGVKLLIANVLILLLSTMPRLFTEKVLDIESFSRFTFAISLNGIIILASESISVTLYPLFSSSNHKDRFDYFKKFQIVSILFLIILLTSVNFYKNIIYYVFPKFGYLDFINIIFIASFLHIHTQVIYNNILKAVRWESKILKINFITTIFSIFIYFILFIKFQSKIDLAAISYGWLIVTASRLVLFEYAVNNYFRDKKVRFKYASIYFISIFLIVNYYYG